MKFLVFLLFAMAAMLLSCKNEDNNPPPVDYHLTVGDTVITIPDSAAQFAEQNFSLNAYLLREFQVARDPNLNHQGSPFTGTLQDWKALGWSTRTTFLLSPYGRDIRTSDDAQYFYQIGTFKDQFGYGWRDTYDPEANLNNPDAGNIWQHPADTTLVPDNSSTLGFDGDSHLLTHYRAMWRFQ